MCHSVPVISLSPIPPGVFLECLHIINLYSPSYQQHPYLVSSFGWPSPFTFGTRLIAPTPTHNPSYLVPCGISMAGALILQSRDTMSLIKADLGSVCVRARAPGLTQTPQQSHPLSPLHEHLHWRAKRDPKAKICSTVYGRTCRWATLGNLKDLKL